MNSKKKLKEARLTNGMVTVLNYDGKPVSELEGKFGAELYKRIIKHATPFTRLYGFSKYDC